MPILAEFQSVKLGAVHQGRAVRHIAIDTRGAWHLMGDSNKIVHTISSEAAKGVHHNDLSQQDKSDVLWLWDNTE